MLRVVVFPLIRRALHNPYYYAERENRRVLKWNAKSFEKERFSGEIASRATANCELLFFLLLAASPLRRRFCTRALETKFVRSFDTSFLLPPVLHGYFVKMGRYCTYTTGEMDDEQISNLWLMVPRVSVVGRSVGRSNGRLHFFLEPSFSSRRAKKKENYILGRNVIPVGTWAATALGFLPIDWLIIPPNIFTRSRYTQWKMRLAREGRKSDKLFTFHLAKTQTANRSFDSLTRPASLFFSLSLFCIPKHNHLSFSFVVFRCRLA